MTNIRLTNGTETFLLGSVIEDERGAAHAKDNRGSGYSRCDAGACEHEHAPEGAAVWHDDEHTEELWVVE